METVDRESRQSVLRFVKSVGKVKNFMKMVIHRRRFLKFKEAIRKLEETRKVREQEIAEQERLKAEQVR